MTKLLVVDEENHLNENVLLLLLLLLLLLNAAHSKDKANVGQKNTFALAEIKMRERKCRVM